MVVHLPEGGRAQLNGSIFGNRLWSARLDLPNPLLFYLACHGHPIRYSYVTDEWPISAYQTVFAEEPGSAEMPSAARPFSAELVTRLVSRGVVVAPFVLHCGVSSPEGHEPPQVEWSARYPSSSRMAASSATAASEWLDQFGAALAHRTRGQADPATATLVIAVLRGLILDRLATGDETRTDDALERFAQLVDSTVRGSGAQRESRGSG